jgi:hypothetical protein
MKKSVKKYVDGGGTKSTAKSSMLNNKVNRLSKLEQSMAKDTGRGDMDQMSRYNVVAAKLEKAKNKLANTSVKKMGGSTKSKKK